MANTTNLNMVKPAGTDHALISVINSNMDIIDGAVGALPSGSTLQGEIDSANQAIVNVKDNLGLENAIANCDSQNVRIAVTNSNTLNTPYKAGLSNFANGCSIIGSINTSDNYIQQIYMSNGETRIFVRRKYAGAWQSWQELALKSEILNIGTLAMTAETKTNKTVTLPDNRIPQAVFVADYDTYSNTGLLVMRRFSVANGELTVQFIASATTTYVDVKVCLIY